MNEINLLGWGALRRAARYLNSPNRYVTDIPAGPAHYVEMILSVGANQQVIADLLLRPRITTGGFPYGVATVPD